MPFRLCPSDHNATKRFPGNDIGNLSYRASAGDIVVQWNDRQDTWNDGSGAAAPAIGRTYTFRGAFSMNLTYVSTLGAGTSNVARDDGWVPGQQQNNLELIGHDMGSIFDGTSNTFMFGEVLVGSGYIPGAGSDNTNAFVRNSYSRNDMTKRNGMTWYSPAVCLTALAGGNVDSVNWETWGFPGGNWVEGGSIMSGFFSILPPNSASCYMNTDTGAGAAVLGGSVPIRDAIVSLSSYHTGGAGVALCDGSVRFLSSTIDYGNPAINGFAYKDGPSPYGALGALGTINGGESSTGL
jgi:prepilin-type processing-associated H-X9-DG protein